MSRHRVYSMDELELDALSGNSYGLQNSGTRFSDSECNVGGQRSVRDIIEHYNRQSNDRDSNVTTVRRHRSRAGADVCEALSSMGSAHRHMMLPTTKSSYFGLNNFNSETQFSASAKKTPSNITTCCKNCSACMCCHNRSHNSFMSFEDVEALPPPPPINENVYLKKSVATVNIANCGSKEQLLNTVVYNTAEDENAQQHYHQQQYRHLHNHKQFAVSHLNGPTKQSAATNDTKAEADYQPLETSYQSIRIIIDILFDQEQQQCCMTSAADIVGSRIETDIPQSHILDEFQQQTLAAKSDAGIAKCNGTSSKYKLQNNST